MASLSPPDPPSADPRSAGPETPPPTGPEHTSGDPGRIHALARLGLYFLAFLVCQVIATAAMVAVGVVLRGPEVISGELSLGVLLWINALLAVILLPTTWAFVGWLDRKTVGEVLAWRRPFSGFLPSTLATTLGVVGILGLWMLLVGLWADLEVAGLSELMREGPAAWPSPLGGWLTLALLAVGFLIQGGLVEEVAFRGYVQGTLASRWDWRVGAGVAALLFSLLHTANPNFQLAALVNTFLLALLLSVLLELTGSIWPPILAHGLWNFLVGSVASLPVSGIDIPRLLDLTLTGPEPLTGGAYGPEGSWLLTALVAPLLALLTWRLEDRQGDRGPGGEPAPLDPSSRRG